MKKLFLLSAVVAAAMAVTSCSSDKEVAVSNEPDITERFNANGEAFINVAINLPSSGTTRANGDYSDGDPKEYAVKNAILVLFAGDNEADATFHAAYNLSTNTSDNPHLEGNNATATTEITQTHTITKDGLQKGQKLYALAILNANGQFEVKDGNKLNVTNANGTTTDFTGKFSDFKDYKLKTLGDTDGTNGLFMTNAPLSTKPGGGSDAPGLTANTDIITLTKINDSQIYTTEAEAQSNPAVNIYVERAAAKVQVSVATTVLSAGVGNTTIKDGSFKWDVDNYNTTFFNVRHVTTDDVDYAYLNKGSLLEDTEAPSVKYRFIDNVLTGTFRNDGDENSTNLYRIYWAIDENYGTNVSTYNTPLTDITWGGTPTAKHNGVVPSLSKSAGDAVYIAENTMGADNLLKRNTTRVVIGVQFNDGSDFWTVDREGSSVIYKEGAATVTNSLAEYLALNIISQSVDYDAWVKKYFKSLTTDQSETILKKFGFTMADNKSVSAVTTTLAESDITGFDFVTGKTASEAVGALDATLLGNLATHIGNNIKLNYYKDGQAYYQVRIKHFGDAETKWKANQTATYAGVYPVADREANYLGRYGVVRNNWYTINIESIKAIGSPDVPDYSIDSEDDTDDDVDQIIVAKINVTRWAMRSQGATL